MDDNPYKPLAPASQKISLRQRIASLSRTQWSFALVGFGLFAWGVIPMAASIVVVSRAIDDGVQPGEVEVLDEWERWAFSPQFVGLALCGIGIFAAALLWRKSGWRHAAIAFTFVTAFFAYDAHERRKLVPPVDLTLDTFFDWQPATKWAVIKTAGDEEYLILIGPLRGILPSGPSAYVFDKTGELVDWETDVGDSVRFERRWLPWSWVPIDREGVQRWQAMS